MFNRYINSPNKTPPPIANHLRLEYNIASDLQILTRINLNIRSNKINIRKIYTQIAELEDYSPSEKVNQLFTELVGQAVKYNLDHDLSVEEIDNLQRICALSEYEMEKHWTNRINSSENSMEELKNFPYFKNYQDLTKLEVRSLQGCSEHKDHNYVFVGGGPLPLTAIVLAVEYSIKSTVVDTDIEAVKLSTRLIKNLGLDDLIKVKHSKGEDFNYNGYNVIFLAALAGIQSETKLKILEKIKATSKKGTHVLARSSWRNRNLLYKKLDEKVYNYFSPVIKVDPFNEIVNSIVIMKNE